MSIRKRVWTTARGVEKEAWVVDKFVDGKRRLESFGTKEAAERFDQTREIAPAAKPETVIASGGAPLELLWGMVAIGHEIGRTMRQTHHMLQTGTLPAKKVGGQWVTTKAALRAYFGSIAITPPES